MEFNVFCDESRHLLKDKKDRFMVIGAIRCSKNLCDSILKDIQIIKERRNYYPEIKWTKVSKNNFDFYLSLLDYFFQTPSLDFRCIVIDKHTVDLKKFNFSEDDFFYRMYFYLLRPKLKIKKTSYHILIDKKDHYTKEKCEELENILENEVLSYINQIQIKVDCVNSKNSLLVQLCDFFIGAVGYWWNRYFSNVAKLRACLKISTRIGIESLDRQIKKFNRKFDIFRIKLQ